MSAAVLAVLVLAVGGLVVVKPAVDNWDDLYRANPFQEGTTTKTVERERATGGSTVTTTTTKGKSASVAERVLGNSGLIFLRLSLLAVTALLVAAAVRRAFDGSYGLRGAPAADASSRPPVGRAPQAADDTVAAAAPIRNGADVGHEGGAASPAASIATLVASRREAMGLSQRELAKRAGVSHTVISRIESGQQAPSAKTLERLVDALS